MKKLVLFLMSALMCVAFFSGCAGNTDDYEYVKSKGELIIGSYIL